MTPYIITSRKTISTDLEYFGYINGQNIKIVYQEKGFIDIELFDEWARTIFFPTIMNKRKAANYKGFVVLLIDGCSSHFSEFFLETCVHLGIVLMVEPPGSSDQIQALDLGVFGAQKIMKNGMRNNDCLESQSNEIVKIYNSWQKVATPDRIVSAFHQAGVVLRKRDNVWVTTADITYARAVRGMNHEKHEIPNSMLSTISIC